MMASRVLSRFLPGAESVFHNPELGHTTSRQRILEEADPSGGHGQYNDFTDDQELDGMLLEAEEEEGSHLPPNQDRLLAASSSGTRKSRLAPRAEPAIAAPADDNDVPASLFMEATKPVDGLSATPYQDTLRPPRTFAPNVRLPGAFQDHQYQLSDSRAIPRSPLPRERARPSRPRIDRKKRALWRWANVENVDAFLLEVYQYYTDHGIWSVLLSRTVHVLTTLFLFSAYMFLSACVDYSKAAHSKHTYEILIPRCMAKTSFIKNILLWIFVFWWTWTIFRYITDLPRLWQLHDFYHYLLDIPDSDIQSVAWERVVEELMSLRDSNPETATSIPKYLRKVGKSSQSKQRMDAHDIANRLMRRDNYFIALINKEVLDLQLTIPFIGVRTFYSKSLEWCISFCFENFIFDEHGHVQQHCLDPKLRLQVIETLRRRLRFAAVISIVMAPFNITAQCILFFSRYYAEFRNTPSQLGARSFTPLAEWKMRDFNELEHDFRRRIKMAYDPANQYLNTFPRDKTIQFLQFVRLIAGTLAGVLGVATLLSPELFLGFEITPGRTAFFYLSVFTAVFAGAHSAIGNESDVHDPVYNLSVVIFYTHYSPKRWRNNYHTQAVRAEVSVLYQMKVLIFLDELLSLVAAPFILWQNAGRPAATIIDFFRQNTVHVDGLGGLCNHAVFDFRKRTRPEDDDDAIKAEDIRDDDMPNASNRRNDGDNKMALSQHYFVQRMGRYHNSSQGGRIRHPSFQHHLPPAFPPMGQQRDPYASATMGPRQRQFAGAKHSPALGTLQQSNLLDLEARNVPAGVAGGNRVRRVSGGHKERRDLELRPEDADLTTSKLIEADRSLADSWKFDDDHNESPVDPVRGRADTGRLRSDAGNAEGDDGGKGVVGLLVDYTRAHQGIKKGGRVK